MQLMRWLLLLAVLGNPYLRWSPDHTCSGFAVQFYADLQSWAVWYSLCEADLSAGDLVTFESDFAVAGSFLENAVYDSDMLSGCVDWNLRWRVR